ncbi:HNH endonuclease [bacterium]|nr:HNH endonuclease [bacterium]
MKRNYNDDAYAQWRKDVFKRDGRRCKMPGCKSRINLQAHHIQKWSTASSLRYDLSNGITLCRKCHDSIKGKENHYVNLFKIIVG